MEHKISLRSPSVHLAATHGMHGRITIHALPPELLLETFKHLSALEPLGFIDYDYDYPDEDSADGGSLIGSIHMEDDEHEDLSCQIPDADIPFQSPTTITHSLPYREDSPTDSDTFTSQSTYAPFSLGWTRVTHVCSIWRQIALGCTDLWSYIPLTLPPAWVDELVRRRKTGSLDIFIPHSMEMHHSQQEDELIAVLHKLGSHRIRCIDNANEAVEVLEILGSETGSTTLALEEMTDSMAVTPAINLNNFKLLRRLDVGLNGDDASLLEFLAVIDLPSLTELVLCTINFDENIPLSPQWCTLLLNLAVLDLHDVNIDFEGSDICLPRLRQLTLVERGPSCGNFVSHARMPLLTFYAVRYLRPDYPILVHLDVIRSMGLFRILDDIDGAMIPALQTLSVTHFYSFLSNVIAIHGWRSAVQDVAAIDVPLPETHASTLDADISHIFEPVKQDGPPQLANFAIALLTHPTLSTLRVLSLDLNPELELGDTSTWFRILHPLRRLRHLRITSPPSKRGTPLCILRAILFDPLTGEYVLPYMSRLTLVDWDPDMRVLASEDESVPGEVLREIILTRVHKTALETVHLVGWRREYDRQWLRYLPQVDGIEIIYERLFVSLSHIHVTDESDSEWSDQVVYDDDSDDAVGINGADVM
ncbi:unnamed protein product [Peniophora sp. CBMAI 1063]|nr:unnamed protein product [Peniophora sp. CBMAI 1063]